MRGETCGDKRSVGSFVSKTMRTVRVLLRLWAVSAWRGGTGPFTGVLPLNTTQYTRHFSRYVLTRTEPSLNLPFVAATRPPHFDQSTLLLGRVPSGVGLWTPSDNVDMVGLVFAEWKPAAPRPCLRFFGTRSRPCSTRSDISCIAYSASVGALESGAGNLTQRTIEDGGTLATGESDAPVDPTRRKCSKDGSDMPE